MEMRIEFCEEKTGFCEKEKNYPYEVVEWDVVPRVGEYIYFKDILNGIVQKVSWSVHEDVDKYGINSPKVTVIYKEIGDEMDTN